MNNSCLCCFEDYIVKCQEAIIVNAKLNPSTAYLWVITDKFDKQYEGDFTTDSNGFWQIPVEDLPDGLLTEYSGSFKLQVYPSSGENCAPVKFLIAQQADCINFTIRAGNREKDNLGCAFTVGEDT